MTARYAALRAAAEKAPKGEWRAIAAPFLRDAWQVEVELPCINGLSAWFTVAVVHNPDAAEVGYSDGVIGDGEDRATHIAAANPAAVLALLADLDAAREALREIATTAACAPGCGQSSTLDAIESASRAALARLDGEPAP